MRFSLSLAYYEVIYHWKCHAKEIPFPFSEDNKTYIFFPKMK